MSAIDELPRAESCRLIDFNEVDIRPGVRSGSYILVVSGEAPCFNMQVSLVPVVYVRQPEYWRIEVVGCLPDGVCLTAVRRFQEFLPLDHVTGTQGIEVVGASRSEQREVPPKQ